jgi:hypothetical protein
VCVDTRDPNLALLAAERMAKAGLSRVTLLTDEAGAEFVRPRNAYGIELKVIPTLQDMDDYSRFMIRELANFIGAEHFLVFQWDGFILDPNLWWDGYLDYDVIGAPWPATFAPPGALVGNGGFSLRSRRLLNALPQLGPPPAKVPEDVFIARNAETLSAIAGIVIAPAAIARHFSIEHRPQDPVDASHWRPARRGTFGFHAWFNFHLVFDDQGLLNFIDQVMTPAQRSRALKCSVQPLLMVNLYLAGRFDCLREVTARTEAELGVALDRNDPAYFQNVIELIASQPPGNPTA